MVPCRHTIYPFLVSAVLAFSLIPRVPSLLKADDTAGIFGEVPTIGAAGGYVRSSGYYTAFFDKGVSLGIAASYPMTFIGKYLLADAELLWEKWDMKQNRDYTLVSYTFRAGPLIFYPLFPSLYPYLGLSFQESSVYLRPGADRRREQSYKAGYAVKSGVFLPVTGGIGIRAGAEYSSYRMSGRDFGQTAFTGGIVYNYRGFFRKERPAGRGNDSPAKKIELLLLDGKMLFSENLVLEAKNDFLAILKLDPDHREANGYLARIAAIEHKLEVAENLMAAKRYYEAIPILMELRPYLKKAGENLAAVRSLLAAEIPEMEMIGVNAYEKKDYDLCIFHMERLLLIDPNNGTAIIYLPRAQKRKEALEKFK